MKLIIGDFSCEELLQEISPYSAFFPIYRHWSIRVQVLIAAASIIAAAIATGAPMRPATRRTFAPDAAVPEPTAAPLTYSATTLLPEKICRVVVPHATEVREKIPTPSTQRVGHPAPGLFHARACLIQAGHLGIDPTRRAGVFLRNVYAASEAAATCPEGLSPDSVLATAR